MGIVKIFALIVLQLFATSCGAPDVTYPKPRPERMSPLDAEPKAYDLAYAALRDVQGLFGGQSVYVNAAGDCEVEIVCRDENSPIKGHNAFTSKRYRLIIHSVDLNRLETLLAKHKFFTSTRSEMRPGIPDEASPELEFGLATGEYRAQWKWEGVKLPDFDPLYSWMLEKVQRVEKTEPYEVAPFDWNWIPEGFTSTRGKFDPK